MACSTTAIISTSLSQAASPGDWRGARKRRRLNAPDLGQKEWDDYRETALATGAFPVGLAPRIIERPDTTFYDQAQSFGYEDSDGRVLPSSARRMFQRPVALRVRFG